MSKQIGIIDTDNDHIHQFFALSYANYFVMPRSILQSMPTYWQKRFVRLMRELDSKCYQNNISTPDYNITARKNGKFTKDPYRHYWRNGQRCLGLVDVFDKEIVE